MKCYETWQISNKKKDYVTRDPEMYDYLTVFMNVIIGAYNTSEAINKGIFQLTEQEESRLIQSGKACLELIPICGGLLSSLAEKTK